MDINLMIAGRKLDCFVAEKVMGWIPIEWGMNNGIDNLWLSKDGQNVFRDEDDDYMSLPFYSTDISAAWMIMDEMKRRNLRPVVYIGSTKHYWARVDPSALADYGVGYSSKEAPLAICKAALKAVAA